VATQTGATGAVSSRTTSTGLRGSRTRKFTPYLFMAPYLILFGVFVLAPAFSAIWISLHNWDYLLPAKPFTGLDNYLDLLSGSATAQLFWDSMSATAQFTIYSVPPLVLFPLGIALILNKKIPGQRLFRAIYFAPYVLGVAVIGIMWRYVLDPNVGVLNYYLSRVGLPGDIAWTNGLPWAWISLVGVTVWWTAGFNAVIFLAGLQGIPKDLYEAARVDGANAWQSFRHVTIPQLRPVLLFVLMITILASANMFGQSYLITDGAPGEETRTAIMYITEEGLRNFRMGSAAAMSLILAAFLAVIGFVNFRFFGRGGED
jgi:multiple sugar transport system permease protein